MIVGNAGASISPSVGKCCQHKRRRLQIRCRAGACSRLNAAILMEKMLENIDIPRFVSQIGMLCVHHGGTKAPPYSHRDAFVSTITNIKSGCLTALPRGRSLICPHSSSPFFSGVVTTTSMPSSSNADRSLSEISSSVMRVCRRDAGQMRTMESEPIFSVG